ncbi:MAG: hypothetical protein DI538_14395 [Azospira oryzae]|nr:MAG: hypothetical protein DI538_14395 [Azospira oryzae]
MKSFKYVFLFCLILVGFGVNAQRYARANGNWTTGNIWASTPNGVAGSAANPTATDDVYTNGFQVSTSSNTTCKNLFISYNVANSLTIGNLRSITVTGTLNGWDDVGQVEEIPTSSNLVFGSGSSLTFTGANVASPYTGYVIYFWDSTVPLARVNFNFGVGTTYGLIVPLSFSTILNLNSGTLAPDNGADISGTSANFVIASGATLTTGDPVSFGNVTINGTLNTTSYVNATTSFTVGATGSFNTSFEGVNQTQGWWNLNNSPSSVSLNATSIINYRASANQIVAVESYGNLDLSGSGTKTVASGGSVNIAGDLTFNNTGVTLNSPQTVIFDGTAAQQISGGGTANFNGGVTINKTSGTLTIAQDINWQGVLNLNQGTLSCTNNSTIIATGNASITGNVVPSFYSVTISGAGNLTSSPGNINIGGNFTNNGTFNANNGTLTFNGSAAQTISGSTNTSFSNISSSNSLSLTVSSPQSITDALTLSAGVFNANGNVTLVSTATRDARIAEITGGATISGDITVQRYLPNSAGVRDYRYLASPVTNATVAQWKAAFPITGTFSDPSTSAEWPGISTPIISATPSMYLYNEAHTPTSTVADRYEAFPSSGSSSSNVLVNGTGYAAFVRQTSPISVISVSGTPKIGPAGVSVTAQSNGGNDGWNLIGNPFASPISWENVTIPSGVNAQIALLDNTNNAGQGAGVYAYYTQGGVGIPASYQGTIASGQAFFVRATSNATIIFQEDDKVPTANPSFIRQGTLADLLRINLTGNGKMDELVIHFKEGASDAADNQFDAFKLVNNNINFSSLSSDGKKMAINTMSALSCTKEVNLVIEQVTAGTHRLNFSDFESFPSEIEVKLVDSFTGKTSTITTSSSVYDFDVTTDAASYGASRFKVQFSYPSILSTLNVVGENACPGTDSRVIVSNSQKGINYYATLNGVAVSEIAQGNGNTLNLLVAQKNLTKGDNQIIVMASSGGCTSLALTQSASIKKDEIYVASLITGKGACQEGEVTLTATGAPVNGSYRWYENSEAVLPIAGQESAVFKTPSLLKSKTYYVSVVNALGCEGAKTAVMAKVTNFDDATITQTGSTTLQSNFESGNQWYLNNKLISGATGKTLEVTESGLYTLKVSVEGNCETTADLTMVVTDLKTQLESKQVYPNPVNDILTIKLPADKGEATGAIQNELGQKIGQISFRSTDDFLIGEFNFEDKMAGIYIVRITQGNSVTNHKIVKK